MSRLPIYCKYSFLHRQQLRTVFPDLIYSWRRRPATTTTTLHLSVETVLFDQLYFCWNHLQVSLLSDYFNLLLGISLSPAMESPAPCPPRQSLSFYSTKQLSFPSMISEPETDMTVNTADTINTKSICKALKLMRGTKLERESSKDRKQRRKEAARKRKEADEILANKS